MDGNGEIISVDQQKYIWMVPFLHGVSKMDQTMREYANNVHVPIHLDVPLRIFLWGPFMKEAKQFMKDNFYQLVMLMAGGMSAFHYHKVIEIVGTLTFNMLFTSCTRSTLVFTPLVFFSHEHINEYFECI